MEPRDSCSLVFTVSSLLAKRGLSFLPRRERPLLAGNIVSHEQTLPSVSQIQSAKIIGCLLFFLPMFPNNLVKRMLLSLKRGTGKRRKSTGNGEMKSGNERDNWK